VGWASILSRSDGVSGPRSSGRRTQVEHGYGHKLIDLRGNGAAQLLAVVQRGDGLIHGHLGLLLLAQLGFLAVGVAVAGYFEGCQHVPLAEGLVEEAVRLGHFRRGQHVVGKVSRQKHEGNVQLIQPVRQLNARLFTLQKDVEQDHTGPRFGYHRPRLGARLG
jgi:hypothetical protein